jgi:hypothetical protein
MIGGKTEAIAPLGVSRYLGDVTIIHDVHRPLRLPSLNAKTHQPT